MATEEQAQELYEYLQIGKSSLIRRFKGVAARLNLEHTGERHDKYQAARRRIEEAEARHMNNKLCRDCKCMVGGCDIPVINWQCEKRVDTVSGAFVLCRDERSNVSIAGYPLHVQQCGSVGNNYEQAQFNGERTSVDKCKYCDK